MNIYSNVKDEESVVYKKYKTSDFGKNTLRSAWRQIICDMYYPMDVCISDVNTFFATAECWQLDGGCSISRVQSDGVSYIFSDTLLKQSTHTRYFLITVPLDKALTVSSHGIQRKSYPGTFIVEQPYIPYTISHGKRTNFLVFKIPHSMFESRMAFPERFFLSVFDCNKGVGAMLIDMINSVIGNYNSTIHSENYTLSKILLDLLALCLEGTVRVAKTNHSSVRIGHLLRVEKYVRINISNMDLTPENIAGNCGVSVSYLHKLFSEQEKSLCTWIRSLRLEMCKNDLENVNEMRSVSNIAYKWGFVDQSHFSRSFKKLYDISPAQYRLLKKQEWQDSNKYRKR